MVMLEKGEEVLIVGAGLQGCAIALFLAKAGCKVTVLDKQVAGRHASSVNAGGLRLLMRDLREYPLAQRAMHLWKNLHEIVGVEAAGRAEVKLGTSQLGIALDDAEMHWARARVLETQQRGILNEELLDAQSVRRLLPGVAHNVLGGIISREDGHANPANASLAFRDAAVAAGATLMEHCALNELVPKANNHWLARTAHGDIHAQWVINCAGAWGAELAASLGETLPMHVYAPSMMVTARVQPFLVPVVLGIDRPLSFKQSSAGSLVIGGGISGLPDLRENTSFTLMDRLPTSALAVIEAFPALANVPIVRTWTGLEGRTADNIPFIGPSALHPRLWHVFGFCGHGFLLAPAVGEVVAQSLISGRLDPRLCAFAPDRFRPSAPVDLKALK
jgi:sarcosine oxidase subunit beta